MDNKKPISVKILVPFGLIIFLILTCNYISINRDMRSISYAKDLDSTESVNIRVEDKLKTLEDYTFISSWKYSRETGKLEVTVTKEDISKETVFIWNYKDSEWKDTEYLTVSRGSGDGR